MKRFGITCLVLAGLSTGIARADDQTRPGTGNADAARIADGSPLVRSALVRDKGAISLLKDPRLRSETMDALFNSGTCVHHHAGLTEAGKQAILARLLAEGLVNPADAASIHGGLEAGVFPAVLDDGSACPHLPQPFGVAPGSSFHGHQSYPGGLAIHEGFNLASAAAFAANYELAYGLAGNDGLPRMASIGVVVSTNLLAAVADADLAINSDIVLAAPLWHDWAKTLVFQWNADGSEFLELSFGGAGSTDDYGAAGDSRTGGHHILSLAEAMARHLPPLFVVAQASAHSAPTLGNEYKVVNWLRTAAAIARVDPVKAGYLVADSAGRLRLPPSPAAAGVDLLAAGQTNIQVEDEIHNLSDADFVFSIPAVTESEAILQLLASSYGYDSHDAATYNTRYRNPVLANLSGERILITYTGKGIKAVKADLDMLRKRGKI